jgi:hypothetical protein
MTDFASALHGGLWIGALIGYASLGVAYLIIFTDRFPRARRWWHRNITQRHCHHARVFTMEDRTGCWECGLPLPDRQPNTTIRGEPLVL